ncbi:MAG: hypothetical protein PUP91_35615 [Rhizonema sp. PD37]|nr:hypothetical protein [Rhizonema sp. PD37]
MKAWKLTLAILMLGTSVCLPKAQAISLSKTEVNQSKSTFLVSPNAGKFLKYCHKFKAAQL